MQVLESKVSDYVLTTVNDQSYREERYVFFKLKTSSPHNLMEVLDNINRRNNKKILYIQFFLSGLLEGETLQKELLEGLGIFS